jgi:hypothetical protein
VCVAWRGLPPAIWAMALAPAAGGWHHHQCWCWSARHRHYWCARPSLPRDRTARPRLRRSARRRDGRDGPDVDTVGAATGNVQHPAWGGGGGGGGNAGDGERCVAARGGVLQVLRAERCRKGRGTCGRTGAERRGGVGVATLLHLHWTVHGARGGRHATPQLSAPSTRLSSMIY